MKLSQILSEQEENSDDKELIENIEKSFMKTFPNGFISVSGRKILGGKLISVVLGIIGNKGDLTSGIRMNDPMYHSFLIRNEDDVYVAEALISSISMNPTQKHMAMSSLKTKWRKTKGDSKKISQTFEKFFKKLKTMIKDNEQDIYRRDSYNDKYFK